MAEKSLQIHFEFETRLEQGMIPNGRSGGGFQPGISSLIRKRVGDNRDFNKLLQIPGF